jgi:hypothetical protein
MVMSCPMYTIVFFRAYLGHTGPDHSFDHQFVAVEYSRGSYGIVVDSETYLRDSAHRSPLAFGKSCQVFSARNCDRANASFARATKCIQLGPDRAALTCQGIRALPSRRRLS